MDFANKAKEMSGLPLLIKNHPVKNPRLKASLSSCAERATEGLNEILSSAEDKFVTVEREAEEYLSSIVTSINSYEVANNCKNCNEEIKEQTLVSAQSEALGNLDHLKNLTPDNYRIDQSKVLLNSPDSLYCSFSGFFTKGQAVDLSVAEVLSKNYDKTLEFIASKKDLITIERDQSRIGKPSSAYIDKKSLVKARGDKSN